MEEFKMVFQIIAFIFIIILIYYFYRYIIYVYRAKRINSFTIRGKNSNGIYNIIYKITRKLDNTGFYKKRNNKYDKYLGNSVYNNEDIITSKIVLGLMFGFIYLFECSLYKLNLNLLIVVVMYLIGYYLIDFIFGINYKRKVLYMNINISKVMIVMNNCYEVNRSHKEVVNSIINEIGDPLKEEFKVVRQDLDRGLDISTSLYRMYERTKISKILYIAELLGLNIRYGISIKDICSVLERDIVDREKIDHYLIRLNNTNKLVVLLLANIPIFVVGLTMMMGVEYIIALCGKKLVYLIIGESIIYIVYLLFIYSLVRRDV